MRTNVIMLATALTAAGLCGATPAAAQMTGMPERHLVRIGFGGGVSVPTSNAADALDNGINGQAFLLLDPGFGFPFRINLGYQKFDWKDVLGQATGGSGESQILSGVAGLSMDLIRLGPIRPYITAGLGAFNVKETLEGAALDGSTASTHFGIDGGGGIALKIGRLEAFIEGRVQNVYTQDGAIDTNSIRAVPVTFGILF